MNKNRHGLIPILVMLIAGLVWSAWMVDASAANADKEISSPQAALDAVAGTLTVNTLEDELVSDGDCSLREAIEAANTNLAVDGCAAGEAAAVDTITFEVEGTITVAEQLVITAGGPLVMDGGNEITISGGDATRVMWVDISSTLTLQRLAIADGYTKGEDGAGLYNNKANITIQECQFLHNRMEKPGRGGGIYSQDGNLSVVDSIFEGNGSSVQDTYGGGGFLRGGQAEFVRTTFRDNESGGLHYSEAYCYPGLGCWSVHYSYPGGGGLYINEASVVIQEGSFVANKGGDGGGGITNGGKTTIVNSTFSRNTAEGIEYSKGGGGILNEGTLTLINSTLSENSYSHDEGGGITNRGSAYITNSIIANNDPSDCAGGMSDGGHNISSDDTCSFSITNSSWPNTDPLLGPLQDNGGPTETYALLDGSPAIDAGSPENCPATDQRIMPRPLDGDGDGQAVCDIGSFELVTEIAFYTLNQSSSGGFGETLVYTLALYNFTDQTDTYSLALGAHAWETTLSTDQVGPLAPGTSETLTVAVTIPLGADWYQTDRVVVTATSISDAGEYSTSIQLTTQAYVPPQISIDPLPLTSDLFTGDSVTQLLTISNGYGVPLDYTISPIDIGVLLLHLGEPDGATTFYDSSLYDNNGVCIGDTCPAAGVPGRYGLAVHFDGVNDTINVANAPSLNPQNAITISAWILADDWDGNRRIVQKGVGDSQYRLLAEFGYFHFVIYSVGRVTTSLPSPGNWHHVAGVYDGTRMQLWVDGALQVEQYMSGLIPTTIDPLYIGTKYPGAPVGDYFLGKMDEVQIFDRALSPAEIQLCYAAGYIGEEIPWLTIDPISGSVPTNSSLPLQVTFDATDLQPASYSTALAVASNDPLNPVVLVPVIMNVYSEDSSTLLTITSDDPDPSLIVEPFTVAVNVSSPLGMPPGQVTVTASDSPATCSITLVDGVGSCQLMLDTVGEYLLTATYEGADIYDPSSDSEPHSVYGYPTKTTIISDEPDPSYEGESITVTFSVTSAWGIPTGEVNVTVNDGSGSCNATLVNGLGSCSMSIGYHGDYLLTASYAGLQVFDPSSDSEPHTVNIFYDCLSAVWITSDEPDPSDPGEPFTVTFYAQGIISGTVTVTVSDSPATCTSELVDGEGSCVMAIDTEGMHTLYANFEGEAIGYPVCSDSDLHYVGEYKLFYLPLTEKK